MIVSLNVKNFFFTQFKFVIFKKNLNFLLRVQQRAKDLRNFAIIFLPHCFIFY